MAYLIYTFFHQYFSPFNVFQYITFRIGAALLTALFLSFVISVPVIKKLTSLKIGQTIRDDGPKTHYVKAGTPTMGGIIILISIVVSTLIWARLDNRFIIVTLIGTLYLGLLGFIDDYLKLVKKNPKGLSPKKKMIGQIIFGLSFAVYLYFFPSDAYYGSTIDIPYLKNIFIDLGVLYIPFVATIVVGSSNAVNLTDGLDGLAVGAILICSLTYIVFAYLVGNINFSNYLRIIYVPDSGELAVFLATIIGAGISFLWYNTYPAEIFMGDTGSLFLGGVLGIVAVLIKQELVLLVAGGVFVVEALSVMLQVGSFRLKKKRIFKMAPLHHHFELSGWSEPKVTIRFWIIGIILALVALSSLKIR